MNPFFLNSMLLLNHFEEAFQRHDRIFQDLRARHHASPAPPPPATNTSTTTTPVAFAKASGFDGRTRSLYSPRSSRSFPSAPSSQSRRSHPAPAGSTGSGSNGGGGGSSGRFSSHGVRRQNTLAREGIKPQPPLLQLSTSPTTAGRSSASRPAGGRSASRVRGSSAYLSNESSSTKGTAERVRGWSRLSSESSGTITCKGLHVVFQANACHGLLAIYDHQTGEMQGDGGRGGVSPWNGFTFSMEFKVTEEMEQVLHLILSYPPPTTASSGEEDYLLLQIDFLQSTVSLYQLPVSSSSSIIYMKDITRMTTSALKDQQSFTLSNSSRELKKNRFYPLSIVWTVEQQQEERLEVHVNNEKIFSCDHLRSLCDVCDGNNGWKMRGGRGRCGVLCTTASSLIVKDCQCRPLPNSSSSSSSSSSCVVLPVVTCNSSRGEPSQTA
eukprot:scaffold5486_cov282-Ochromonas_danica.AAC.1